MRKGLPRLVRKPLSIQRKEIGGVGAGFMPGRGHCTRSYWPITIQSL